MSNNDDEQTVIYYETLAKRMIALNQMGCYIESQDGHYWIEEKLFDDFPESRLGEVLQKAGVRLNSKIYGGVLDTLTTIDAALRLAGHATLLEYYEVMHKDTVIYLGFDKVHTDRMDALKPGQGGIG